MNTPTHTQVTHNAHAEPRTSGARVAGLRLLVNDTSDPRSTPTRPVWRAWRTVYFADLPGGRGSVVVGRSRACDLVIEHHTVSARHCRIDRTQANEYSIEDCGSANGVYLATHGPSDVPRRVDWGVLSLGCYVYLGDVALVPIDARGEARITAVHVSEHVRHAHDLYGSGSHLARHLGITGSVYQFLARFWRNARASV